MRETTLEYLRLSYKKSEARAKVLWSQVVLRQACLWDYHTYKILLKTNIALLDTKQEPSKLHRETLSLIYKKLVHETKKFPEFKLYKQEIAFRDEYATMYKKAKIVKALHGG